MKRQEHLLNEAIENGTLSCFQIPWTSAEEPKTLETFRLTSVPKELLSLGKAVCWILRMEEFDVHSLIQILDASELDRIAQLKSIKERCERTVARIFLRLVLAHYSGLEPNEITLKYGPEGKPYICADFSFNCSHSNGLLVIVVSRAKEVGVDLEGSLISDNALLGISKRFFSGNEQALLQGRLLEERAKMFQRMWTLKEAWLKSTGMGITSVLETPDATVLTKAGETAQLEFVQYGSHKGFQFAYENATCTALCPVHL